MDQGLTVGQVAKKAKVNAQTVRFYERQGLVTPSKRSESGYRVYSANAPQKIRFIKNAQELGFTLKEVSSLLKLKISNRAHCGDVKKKAESKVKDVQDKINQLKSIERVLNNLIQTCQVEKKTDDCPILKSLDKEAVK